MIEHLIHSNSLIIYTIVNENNSKNIIKIINDWIIFEIKTNTILNVYNSNT